MSSPTNGPDNFDYDNCHKKITSNPDCKITVVRMSVYGISDALWNQKNKKVEKTNKNKQTNKKVINTSWSN